MTGFLHFSSHPSNLHEFLIYDKFWERFLRRLFPNVVFINGSTYPLPPVDVLMLNRVTLVQYCIGLLQCPASLILSSSQLRLPSGWIHNFWQIPHTDVGGCTDGYFTRHIGWVWWWFLLRVHQLIVFPVAMFVESFVPLFLLGNLCLLLLMVLLRWWILCSPLVLTHHSSLYLLFSHHLVSTVGVCY